MYKKDEKYLFTLFGQLGLVRLILAIVVVGTKDPVAPPERGAIVAQKVHVMVIVELGAFAGGEFY